MREYNQLGCSICLCKAKFVERQMESVRYEKSVQIFHFHV